MVYRLVISNDGNINLTGVVLASNCSTLNASSLPDTLGVGDVVTLDAHVTYNNSMIRAANIVW
jgi:hypothetical protein